MYSRTRPHAHITGWGSHTPPNVLTSESLAKTMKVEHDWIVSRCGVRTRCVAEAGENTTDLAAMAGRKALVSARLDATDLDALLYATSTPDYLLPHGAAIVQMLIGARNALAFDVGATFCGFVYALAQAEALIESGRAERVLVIAAETLTRIVDMADRDSGFLFGDGAAAAVLEAGSEPGLLGPFVLGSAPCNPTLLSAIGPCHRQADAQGNDSQKAGLKISGPSLFRTAVRVMVQAVEQTLEDNRDRVEDFDWIVPHQANLRIIESVAKRLQLPMERFLISLDRYGNTGAASIPLTVADAIATGKISNGDRLLMLSCGAGLVWGSASLEIRLPSLPLNQVLPGVSFDTTAPSKHGSQP